MKKLMIALSAATMAFGLFAAVTPDPIAKEGFNGALVPGFTISGTNDCTISATPYVSTYSKYGTAGSPDCFRDTADAEGPNLVLKTKLDEPATFGFAQRSMAGVYFDSMVKFTACDDDLDAASYDGAKLMVWIKEDESGKQTFMVTAGWLKDTENATQAKNYACGAPSDYGITGADDWCRLTIKAVADITDGAKVSGFVVFVNGKWVEIQGTAEEKSIGVAGSAVDSLTPAMNAWKKNNALFPSLVAGNAYIEAVCVAGQGGLDDMALFTGEPQDVSGKEFAKDHSMFTLNWTADDVTAISYTVDESEATLISDLAAGSVTFAAEPDSVVSVDVTYADGKMAGAWTATGADVSGSDFTVTTEGATGTIVAQAKGATFNGKDYATITEAVSAANAITEGGSYVLKLYQDYAQTIVINNTTSSFVLTIDLAGKTITGAPALGAAVNAAIAAVAGPIFIMDSVGGGTVNQGTNDAVLDYDEGSFTISGGTFNGIVWAPITMTEDSEAKFSYADNNNEGVCTIDATCPDGKTLVKSGDYWVLGSAVETVTVEAPKAIANGSYTVNPNGVVTKGTTVAVTVTPTVTVGSITVNGVEIVPVSDVYTTNITANADLTFTVVITELAWPDPKDIPEEAKVSDLVPSCPQDLADANAKKLVTWATEQSIPITAAGTILPDAFLLNCANTEAAIEAAKKDFVIPSITIGADGTVTVADPTMKVNGTITIKGKVNLSDAEWGDKAGKTFFKAFLGF